MKEIKTEYGIITDYVNLEMHSATQPASLLVTGRTEIKTQHGTLIPQYEVEDMGRKDHKYLHFYPNGTLKKLPLQQSQDFETRYGTIAAEHVLFYKDGSLKKLFPLAGKLSGYWTEDKEYALAEDLTLPLPSGPITAKMICVGLYKSGALRSLTLWPGEAVCLPTPIGPIDVRTGIAFYETGELKSLEPLRPTAVDTPIGSIQAFDSDPEGISGDINSLMFGLDGQIIALTTTNCRVVVTVDSETEKIYSPKEKESLCSESVMVSVPLQIEFLNGKVRFNKSFQDEYDLTACRFRVEPYTAKVAIPCYECS
jgi:hypothetical protein